MRARLRLVAQPSPRHTLILQGDAGAMVGTLPPGTYDLWLERRGPRLFAPHAFVGPRMWWVVAEERALLTPSAVGGQVAAGVAPFLEYARAWHPGATAAAGGNLGVALRLVPPRFATDDVAELAVGYRFGGARRGARWAFGIRSAVPL